MLSSHGDLIHSSDLTLLDSQTNERLKFANDDLIELPIMAISPESLQPSFAKFVFSFFTHLIQSSWITLAGLLTLVCITFSKRKRSGLSNA
ncbi:hypothetical protein Pla22_05310 [Rubripirellula amarantea]|uniref:Uncharacterized protein n=1 Tax=Rubripirellula amarantea TaxID=2527999 RepID=A0A5C5WS41_9BACT|nr:hypothetical protein Pla22_05310 [Rubripirellula amarantea]